MKIYSILFLTFLAGCGIPKSDFEALKSENELLKTELAELQMRNEEINYLNKHSQVVLANTELKKLKSSYNGQEYIIKVKLPRGYENGNKTYPVLYVTDAETNFGGITYIVQRLIKDKLIPPLIVVGIAYNTDYKSFYRLRGRDLTPKKYDKLKIGPTGGAEKFCDFLSNELFPFIGENYRVENNDRAIYGHSYGGLFGSYVLLKRSDLFNKYLLLSPSLWYSNNLMLEEANKSNLNLKSTGLYMASGELEPRIDDLQIEFASVLRNKKLSNLRMKDEVMDNETHRTIFGIGFTNGMRFLYARQKE